MKMDLVNRLINKVTIVELLVILVRALTTLLTICKTF